LREQHAARTATSGTSGVIVHKPLLTRALTPFFATAVLSAIAGCFKSRPIEVANRQCFERPGNVVSEAASVSLLLWSPIRPRSALLLCVPATGTASGNDVQTSTPCGWGYRVRAATCVTSDGALSTSCPTSTKPSLVEVCMCIPSTQALLLVPAVVGGLLRMAQGFVCVSVCFWLMCCPHPGICAQVCRSSRPCSCTENSDCPAVVSVNTPHCHHFSRAVMTCAHCLVPPIITPYLLLWCCAQGSVCNKGNATEGVCGCPSQAFTGPLCDVPVRWRSVPLRTNTAACFWRSLHSSVSSGVVGGLTDCLMPPRPHRYWRLRLHPRARHCRHSARL
jgi:hypothetical protein